MCVYVCVCVCAYMCMCVRVCVHAENGLAGHDLVLVKFCSYYCLSPCAGVQGMACGHRLPGAAVQK